MRNDARSGNQLKCLYFDRSGFCLWGKRLEHGRFISDWSRARTQEMDWTALKRKRLSNDVLDQISSLVLNGSSASKSSTHFACGSFLKRFRR